MNADRVGDFRNGVADSPVSDTRHEPNQRTERNTNMNNRITTVTATRINIDNNGRELRITLRSESGATTVLDERGMLESDCPHGLGMSHAELPGSVVDALCVAISVNAKANEWTVAL
jgi:hypothetical protein